MATGHPVWCDPTLCDVADQTLPVHGGMHRSAPILLDLAPLVIGEDRLQVARASLARVDRVYDTETYLVLNSGGRLLSIPVLKSAEVLIQLARLIGQGELDRNQ